MGMSRRAQPRRPVEFTGPVPVTPQVRHQVQPPVSRWCRPRTCGVSAVSARSNTRTAGIERVGEEKTNVKSDSRDVTADGIGHDWRGSGDGTDRQRQGHARRALPDLPRLHRAADDAGCHVGLLDPSGRAQHSRDPPSVSCHAGAGDVCRERRALRRSSGCCGRRRPAATAVAVYLHISCAGPLLASGFWLVSTERFDPRTAKLRFGQIAGMGTLGGLLSAVLAERVGATLGAPALLLVLAAIQFACAVVVRALAIADRRRSSAAPRRRWPRRVGTDTAAGPGRAAIRTAGRGRDAAPAAARLRRAARHDQRGAARLRVQGAAPPRCSAAATSCCGSSPCTTRRRAC